jgi:glycosyltransferase involved in cell wall biosynthesis
MIPAAVESVLGQTFSDWELIIIDDGSADNTRAVIEKYDDRRIKYFRKENQERSAARNNGIDMSTGRYICFLDSDDQYLPDHLLNFYNKLEQLGFPDCFMFCDIYTEGTQAGSENIYINCENYNPLERIFCSLICVIQACISRTILLGEKFNEKINLGEDMELWSRIVIRYPLIYLDAQTAVIGEHGSRSVHLMESPYKQNLVLAKRIFRTAPSHMSIRRSVRWRFMARCHYGQMTSYIGGKQYSTAFIQLVKSFFLDPQKQFKHKMYLAFSLIFNKKKAHHIITHKP